MNDAEIKRWQLYIHQRVKVDTDTGCWVWQGALNGTGYGAIGPTVSKFRRAHRLAYEVFIGSIPEGLQVRHQCHNRSCCNPAHLLVGTHQDNMIDSAEDGRFNGRHNGGNTGRKLTEEKVLEIKRLNATGEHSRFKIADMLGIGASQVGNILNGKSWKHLH